MSKPIAPLMRDEVTGELEVMQHALTFEFIPRIKTDYGRKNMAHGGFLHPLDEDLPKEDEDTELDIIAARVRDFESRQRRNVNQPISDEFEGSDAQNEGVEAGTGTLDSMMEGWANLLSEFTPTPMGILTGAVKGMIGLHQQGKEIDAAVAAGRGTTDPQGNITSTTTMGTEADPVDVTGHDPSQTGFGGLFGKHDVSDDALHAQVTASHAQVTAAEAQTAQQGADVGVIGQEEVDEAVATAAAAEAAAAEAAGNADDDATGAATGEAAEEGNASGGLVKGYQEGAMVEGQADTTMDASGLGPMGLVDDMAGDQVTGVEDDLNMEVEEGAYVLNADTVELVGLKDLNQLTKDAIDIAIESDIPLPKSVDPTQKVPIKISNGEFVIPAILVPIIGLENLEKMNKRGLEYREKNREEAPPQEAQQQDVPVEPSEVPSRGVPGEINLAQGGALADQMNQLM
jgi:hypothetical protein